eukprot:2540156-Amphidinium_carterae.2
MFHSRLRMVTSFPETLRQQAILAQMADTPQQFHLPLADEGIGVAGAEFRGSIKKLLQWTPRGIEFRSVIVRVVDHHEDTRVHCDKFNTPGTKNYYVLMLGDFKGGRLWHSHEGGKVQCPGNMKVEREQYRMEKGSWASEKGVWHPIEAAQPHGDEEVRQGFRISIVLFTPARLRAVRPLQWNMLRTMGFPSRIPCVKLHKAHADPQCCYIDEGISTLDHLDHAHNVSYLLSSSEFLGKPCFVQHLREEAEAWQGEDLGYGQIWQECQDGAWCVRSKEEKTQRYPLRVLHVPHDNVHFWELGEGEKLEVMPRAVRMTISKELKQLVPDSTPSGVDMNPLISASTSPGVEFSFPVESTVPPGMHPADGEDEERRWAAQLEIEDQNDVPDW